MNIIENARFR